MKTTLEIPDTLFRRAKSVAAERGIPLRQLVTDALAEKLRGGGPGDRPWLGMLGGLHSLHKETARINKIVDSEFNRIDPGDWK